MAVDESRPLVVVWESHAYISGGQRMTLLVADALKEVADLHFLIPAKGPLSDALDQRGMPYSVVGSTEAGQGKKGWSAKASQLGLLARSLRRGKKVVRDLRPDALYAPGPTALLQSALCGRSLGVPVIWHVHHYFLDGSTSALLRKASRFESVRQVIAVSQCVADRVVDPAAAAKVQVMYNPVDTERFDGIRKPVPDIQPLLDAAGSHDVMLGQVALIQPDKNQFVSLGIVGELVRRGIDASLVLVGGAKTQQDQDYLEKVLARAESDADTKGRVFYAGERDDVERIMPYFDALLLPSHFEGCPLAGLEANASRVPVVAVNVAGAGEMVQHGMAGRTYEPDDVSQAADAVVSLTSSEVRAEVARSARAFALTQVVSSYREKVVAAFSALLEEGGPRV